MTDCGRLSNIKSKMCAEVPILQPLLPTYSDYLPGKTLSDVMMLPHTYQPAKLEVFVMGMGRIITYS